MWLSWVEHCPIDQKVTGWVPNQGTYPGCGFDPQLGHIGEINVSLTWIFFSLSLFPSPALPLSPPLALSLKAMNNVIGKGLKI